MLERPLSEFFEKLYFHEIDARDKLFSRLQLPFAVLVSLVGVLGFMLQNLRRDQTGWWMFAFFIAFSVAATFMLCSGLHLRRAAYGHTYAFLPTAGEWDGYRKECSETYAERADCSELTEAALRDAIYQKQIGCASTNALINEERSYQLFLAMRFLSLAVVALFIAFVVFFFGRLDKSAVTKPLDVHLVNSVPFQGASNVSQQAASSATTGSSSHQVREGQQTATVPADRK